ncbi:plasmid replication initiator TrfA [Pseudomonas chengduensis]|nr:plasmid replication initiator TrfA [Pseudomonas chengduensis]MDH1684474.1 plasmid replication initiator TrfA [Pseudomonas chengduensis]
MNHLSGAHAKELKSSKAANSAFKILQSHTDRLASNNELCRGLLRELETGLLPPRPEIITIPSLPQRASAMPTAWVRTSLFVNQPQTKAKFLINQVLESYDTIRIEYTGEQLNMFDNDVYIEIIRLAQGRAPGEKILFNRHSLLRALGISGGKKNYEALHKSLQKLKGNTIKITKFKTGYDAFSLIDQLSWDEEIGCWRFSIGDIVIDMLSTELSYIDLDIRQNLTTPLSKYLQNYMSAGLPGEREVKVDNLMRLSGTTSQLKDFLGKGRGLTKALDELKAAGFLVSYAIHKNKNGENIVRWNRSAHQNSKRYASAY